jgi:carbamoyl-phosphate synthase large subunit
VVFEVNPRFSSTTSARAHYGYNEPEMSIRHLVLGEDLERPVIRPGRFFRVIEEVHVDEDAYQQLRQRGLIEQTSESLVATV